MSLTNPKSNGWLIDMISSTVRSSEVGVWVGRQLHQVDTVAKVNAVSSFERLKSMPKKGGNRVSYKKQSRRIQTKKQKRGGAPPTELAKSLMTTPPQQQPFIDTVDDLQPPQPFIPVATEIPPDEPINDQLPGAVTDKAFITVEKKDETELPPEDNVPTGRVNSGFISNFKHNLNTVNRMIKSVYKSKICTCIRNAFNSMSAEQKTTVMGVTSASIAFSLGFSTFLLFMVSQFIIAKIKGNVSGKESFKWFSEETTKDTRAWEELKRSAKEGSILQLPGEIMNYFISMVCLVIDRYFSNEIQVWKVQNINFEMSGCVYQNMSMDFAVRTYDQKIMALLNVGHGKCIPKKNVTNRDSISIMKKYDTKKNMDDQRQTTRKQAGGRISRKQHRKQNKTKKL